jgi:hypothetical protein
MPIFAVPGLMPAVPVNIPQRYKSFADGSLCLIVHTETDQNAMLPSVKIKITDLSGEVIIQDLEHACVFTETSDTCRNLVIRLLAGILPIGLVTVHTALQFSNGEDTIYRDFEVEVPASPFHVTNVELE